jgi:uncharacterized membrane protein
MTPYISHSVSNFLLHSIAPAKINSLCISKPIIFGHLSEGISTQTPTVAFWLSLIAIALLGISGWLGGKLVYVYGTAVQSPPESPPSG